MDIQHASSFEITIEGKRFRLVPINDDRQANSSLSQSRVTLSQYVQQLVDELNGQGRFRTAETYRAARNSVLRFIKRDTLFLDELSSPFMQKYEHFLHSRGLSTNSSSFYLRVLRTIYNRAVADGLVTDRQPFVHVYTGIGRTVRRAVSLSAIQQLYQLKELTPQERFARDVFLFSFYTHGMAFIDIAYLSPGNIRDGVLTYRRQKTDQLIAMRWEPQMQAIVDRYSSAGMPYLLPIIKRCNGCERSQYRNAQRRVNEMLRLIGQRLDIPKLTFYVARHSWASIARSMEVPLDLISQGMGHESERTTQIYLKTLNLNRLDAANLSIIRAVEHASFSVC